MFVVLVTFLQIKSLGSCIKQKTLTLCTAAHKGQECSCVEFPFITI